MSLKFSTLRLIGAYIRELAKSAEPVPVLALGYPDIILTPAELATLVGDEAATSVLPHPQNRAILAYHGVAPDAGKVAVDADHLVALLGGRLTSVDLYRHRGSEVLHDLNQPFPDDWEQAFGLVFDNNTVHACFNVAQALLNTARAVRVGGVALHVTSLNHVNIGYYELSPVLFGDFYELNGFNLQLLHAASPDGEVLTAMPRHRPFSVPGPVYYGIAARRQAVVPPTWPVMGKFAERAPKA